MGRWWGWRDTVGGGVGGIHCINWLERLSGWQSVFKGGAVRHTDPINGWLALSEAHGTLHSR
ncbi:MAG: hypothetical protein V9G16_08525 [Nitrosomonas sp.]